MLSSHLWPHRSPDALHVSLHLKNMPSTWLKNQDTSTVSPDWWQFTDTRASQLSQAPAASGSSTACLHFQTNPGPLVGSKGKPKFLRGVQGAPHPDTCFNPHSAETLQRTWWSRGVSPHLGTIGGGRGEREGKRPRTLGREGQCAALLKGTATS